MQLDVITIGDEILIGQIVDTNSAWMGQQLNDKGIKIRQILSIGDDANEIKTSLNNSLNKVDIVLMTGGLGPTKDDITKKTLCEFFGTELVYSEEMYQNVMKVIGTKGKMNELNQSQAYIPKDCKVFTNRVGTAPIMCFEKNGKMVVSMPGVPDEMKTAMKDDIIPYICSKFKTQAIYHKSVIEVGLPESALAIELEDWENNLPSNIKLAYLPSFGMVKLRLSAYGDSEENLKKQVEKQMVPLRKILGSKIVAEEDVETERALANLLIKNELTIATAESCTGGNIAHLLTTISGSSKYFRGSVVAYCDEIKHKILGVKSKSLLQYSAVSQQVVEEMAKNVAKKFGADVAITTSGYTEAHNEKEIGEVWIGLYYNGKVYSKHEDLGTFRNRNITRASLAAMTFAIDIINNNRRSKLTRFILKQKFLIFGILLFLIVVGILIFFVI